MSPIFDNSGGPANQEMTHSAVVIRTTATIAKVLWIVVAGKRVTSISHGKSAEAGSIGSWLFLRRHKLPVDDHPPTWDVGIVDA